MKSLLKLGLLSLVIVVFTATSASAERSVRGNRDVVKETRKIRSFDAIDISSAFEVELTQSDKESLVIEADENLLDHIYTEVVGGTLKIYTKGNIRNINTMKAYISFKMISEIEVSGACEIVGMNKMKFDEFTFDASGASEIELSFTATQVELDLSGASEINFSGYADKMEIYASGAVEINALDFEVKKCEIDVSGACSVKVFVTEDLEIEASGATSVRYKGKPFIEIDVSGASSVRRY